MFNLFGAACEITCPECSGTKTIVTGHTTSCYCMHLKADGTYSLPAKDCKGCNSTGRREMKGGCGKCNQKGMILTDFGKEVLDFMLRHIEVAKPLATSTMNEQPQIRRKP